MIRSGSFLFFTEKGMAVATVSSAVLSRETEGATSLPRSPPALRRQNRNTRLWGEVVSDQGVSRAGINPPRFGGRKKKGFLLPSFLPPRRDIFWGKLAKKREAARRGTTSVQLSETPPRGQSSPFSPRSHGRGKRTHRVTLFANRLYSFPTPLPHSCHPLASLPPHQAPRRQPAFSKSLLPFGRVG